MGGYGVQRSFCLQGAQPRFLAGIDQHASGAQDVLRLLDLAFGQRCPLVCDVRRCISACKIISVADLRITIAGAGRGDAGLSGCDPRRTLAADFERLRSEEHTSELQSLMRISYAVFCLKKKKKNNK